MTQPEIIVQRIHFEDRSGAEFERMCFAHLWHSQEWRTLEWYGQSGQTADATSGASTATARHIATNAPTMPGSRSARRKPTSPRVAALPHGLPNRFTFIVGGSVSAQMKNRVRQEGERHGFRAIDVWSGVELEERLRSTTPAILRRFVEGVAFPESAELLRRTSSSAVVSDHEALELMSECFDRPAFTTPLRQESHIPDLKKATTDTIEALNTGIRRLRDGTDLGRIPRRSELGDPAKRAAVGAIVDKLVHVRADYDALIRTGDLRECCDGTCGTLFATWRAEQVLDEGRASVLAALVRLVPSSAPRLQDRMFLRHGRDGRSNVGGPGEESAERC